MSNFKANPKQKNTYPGILSRFQEQRQGFRGFKNPKAVNLRAKAVTAKMLQRFSGKLGK